MAAKKKAKKKTTVSRKKLTTAKKPATKRGTPKSPVKKKQAKKKVASRKKAIAKTAASKTGRASTRRPREKNETVDTLLPGFKRVSAPSGRQSGDLQGLSDVEGADSESVDELLDEGNAFEAGAVRGVEHADDADEREVETREVLEDDVPDEYLDKD
ncbi:MAG: hypothetical protein WCF26_18265 [Candidatus Sulfotelmatobacter sp.]